MVEREEPESGLFLDLFLILGDQLLAERRICG